MATFSDDDGISNDDGQLREEPPRDVVQDTNKALCEFVNYYWQLFTSVESDDEKNESLNYYPILVPVFTHSQAILGEGYYYNISDSDHDNKHEGKQNYEQWV